MSRPDPPPEGAADPSEERLQEVASQMAHAIKTPLAVLRGYARTLLEVELSEDERRWFLEAIAEQAERLAREIDGIVRGEGAAT